IESYILQLLDQKIKLFELVVGELDLILGEFGGAQEFEGRLAKEWLAAESEEDFARRVETMGVEIEKSSAAGKEQEELNSLIAPDDNAIRLERRFETLSVPGRSEEHTSELQSRGHLVCRLLLEKKKKGSIYTIR